MWLRSIYLSSVFAVLVWVFPWVVGNMLYHFQERHWKRATGWLLGFLIIPSLILAWIFTYALENILFTPHTMLLYISIIVMMVQAAHWRVLWRSYRDRNIIHRLRTIALYAWMTSSLLGFLGIGSLIKEYTYKHKERQIATEEALRVGEILASAGYTPFPGALYSLGEKPVIAHLESEDDEIGRGTLTIQFHSDAHPDDVLDYYNKNSRAQGNWALRGITRVNGKPSLIVLGENRTAMEITGWTDGYWIVSVHYGFEGGLDQLTQLEYIFEPPPELRPES